MSFSNIFGTFPNALTNALGSSQPQQPVLYTQYNNLPPPPLPNTYYLPQHAHTLQMSGNLGPGLPAYAQPAFTLVDTVRAFLLFVERGAAEKGEFTPYDDDAVEVLDLRSFDGALSAIALISYCLANKYDPQAAVDYLESCGIKLEW